MPSASASDPIPDYLTLSDADLLQQCRMETFRASGPGGQHRNKTDSGVRLRHDPSGVTAQAVERRSQHQNRTEALHRLREAIAVQVRRLVDLEAYTPPPELAAILPGATSRIGSKQDDYWRGAQALLDLLAATDGAVSDAADRIGLSTGQLSRLITEDPRLLRAVNAMRSERGLKPLR